MRTMQIQNVVRLMFIGVLRSNSTDEQRKMVA